MENTPSFNLLVTSFSDISLLTLLMRFELILHLSNKEFLILCQICKRMKSLMLHIGEYEEDDFDQRNIKYFLRDHQVRVELYQNVEKFDVQGLIVVFAKDKFVSLMTESPVHNFNGSQERFETNGLGGPLMTAEHSDPRAI